ncbi:molybdopterin-binding protein [Dyella dinghuensis]|uniref:Molybdopterin-binding protein n=1 Tax=Dyella dinghuensis TaxID=1920169 RepID=A0A432LNN9_9GAMM|nr:molybdopterin-dependent oxidoreductase [Dyella dinghuensis]RUL61458.1 molybdopterin-binding protein [Dyella dinghuensis]
MLPKGGCAFITQQTTSRAAGFRCGNTAMTRRWLALLLALLAFSSINVAAQTAPADQPVVRVIADGKAPITLDHTALAAMPRVSVTASAHHEAPSRWQGVSLQSILQKVDAPSGEKLRGHAMTTIVRVTASDHYQIVFSLAELDPMLGNEQAMLADTQDGHPIAKDGPYRIVVPGDKRPARWIRSVTTIEVINTAAPSP